MNNEEVILINNESFYRIPNGTSYDYAPIPKEFKIYFDRLKQENKELKQQKQELRTWLKEETKKGGSSIDLSIRIHTLQEVLNKLNELEGGNNE